MQFLRARSGLAWPRYTVARSLRSGEAAGKSLRNYKAVNEPFLDYAPGSEERKGLDNVLRKYEGVTVDIPVVIGGERITTANVRTLSAPFDHSRTLIRLHLADDVLVRRAVSSALAAREKWESLGLDERSRIILRAADLMREHKHELVATSMLGQAKTVYQAMIDAGAEMPDFARFNVQFAQEAASYSPVSTKVSHNRVLLRGCEGFWAAITPFNFTAIGGNLALTPALLGNVVLWKPPVDSSVLSNWLTFELLEKAGVPPGVINFVPARGPVLGDVITTHPDLAGVNFTGSTSTFRTLWRNVATNMDVYRAFPRLVGETGGKNFHLLHPSADLEKAAVATIRSAFEFSGQKCSACSRCYVPRSLANRFRERLLALRSELLIGSPLDIEHTFTSAVIDGGAFDKIRGYVELGKKDSKHVKLLGGGKCDASKGWYIEPTVFETSDPHHRLMKEEIFGPLLTIYVYDDAVSDGFDNVLKLVDSTTEYALTGAVFCHDEAALAHAMRHLRHTAGNFYVNDQSTGAVVGQQPFGGARLSGTNDKAGGPWYIHRFVSPQTIKESSWTSPTYLQKHHNLK